MQERQKLIETICEQEWIMFDKVNNVGGRAGCQNNPDFFKKMRRCQFEIWSTEMLSSYHEDLNIAAMQGRNLLSEKYAYMMEDTHPLEFQNIKDKLPIIEKSTGELINSIVAMQIEMEAKVDAMYPAVRSNGRPLRRSDNLSRVTSFETYLTGELKTYSPKTLLCYLKHLQTLNEEEKNYALMIAENTVRAYGYKNLEDAEKKVLSKRQQL